MSILGPVTAWLPKKKVVVEKGCGGRKLLLGVEGLRLGRLESS